MSRFPKFVIILTLASCGLIKSDPSELFSNFLEPQGLAYLSEFRGEGQNGFPVLYSWGLFNYTCNEEYIDYLRNLEHSRGQSQFNQRFKLVNPKYFNKDLKLDHELSKQNLRTDMERENCIFLMGIFSPYAHEILIDTITYETVHFVSGIRE